MIDENFDFSMKHVCFDMFCIVFVQFMMCPMLKMGALSFLVRMLHVSLLLVHVCVRTGYFNFYENMSIWNSNLIHHQMYGATQNASYTLDFFSDTMSRKIITMNIMLNYNGEETILENVIGNGKNNIYAMIAGSGVAQQDAIDIVSNIMTKLSSQKFVVPKIVLQ